MFLKITQFLNAFFLIRFSVSKLFAWPVSVEAFIEMSRPIGIDPTFFRLFTGVLITIVSLSYFSGFLLLINEKTKPSLKNIRFIQFSNILGFGVLTGALLAEFFLRQEPKWPLVFIAGFIVSTSLLNLNTLKIKSQTLST